MYYVFARQISLLSFCLFGVFSMAQVDVVSLDPDPYSIRSNNLFFGTLQNSGNAGKVILEVTIATSDGRLVIAGTSAPIHLNAGMVQVQSLGASINSTKYGSNGSAKHMQSFGMLPSGIYDYCLEVIPYSDIESGDQDCERMFSEALTAMDLVYPMDGDTIMETRPTLTWTTTELVLDNPELEFSLSLVEAKGDRDPYAALATEQPIIQLPRVQGLTIPYPMDAEALVPGRSYAWQISKTVAGQVVDETEAWKFTIYKEHIPAPMKYVRIDRQHPGSYYRPVDNRIYFRFDEVYKGSALSCRILDTKNEEILPQAFNENESGSEDLKAIGLNEYEVDLLPYQLGKGIYTLVIRNEKDRTYYLKFILE